jgi:glycosyltransferase involved in cell wall biosynthesis
LTNLSVIYLGRRGGGASLLVGLADFVIENNLSQSIDFYISDSNKSQTLREGSDLDITRVHVPHSVRKIDSKFLLTIRSLAYSVTRINKRSSKVLFIMPSPLDWIFNKCISRSRIEKYFIIHDAAPHFGENWPSQKSLLWRFKSGAKLITLSEYVKNQILDIEKNARIVSLFHPVFRLGDTQKKLALNDLPKFKYSLFIGRIRKYKGLDLLLDAIKSIPTSEFVIAGEGQIKSELPKNCHKINRWLDEEEISGLIQNAQLVIFPYIEASQSGLLPIVIEHEKVVVVSKVGGLLEQIDGYEKAYIFESGNLASLVDAISKANKEITGRQTGRNNVVTTLKNHSEEEFWKKLLSAIDFYG